MNGKEYVKYSPKKVCDYESLSEEKYNRYIIKELEKAIDSEGPISENLLLEIFKQMINITKMGTRVRRIFDLNMKYVYHREKFIEDKTSFYLPLNQTMDNVNYYRQSSYDIRHISDIPSCEIRWAIIDLLDAHGTLKIEELSNLLCGIFGVKNVVQTINEAISKKVYYILSTYNDFTIYNGFIKKK